MKKQNKKTTAILLLINIIALLSTLTLVCGYQVTGYKWLDPDLFPYYYKDWTDYSEVDDSTEDYNDWESLYFIFEETASTSCDLQIHKVDIESDWDGYCHWYYSGTTITSVDLAINDHYVDGYSSDERKSVIAHELGHSFGLDHDNENEARIMIENTRWRWDYYETCTPQQDDINGIEDIYG
ncbi:MAG TPA: matrixin family metalloprotease [Patescibacteria group bacterium]|nr:matrixin family metalloprotease [Patescibacteria group bacterium]